MSDETAAWESFVDSLPPAVQEKARAYPATTLYRIKQTGQLAHIESYSEGDDGSCETCCVFAWYEWSGEALGHGVFGVHFTDLEPVPATAPSDAKRPTS